MSEQLWPERIRGASREFSTRWRSLTESVTAPIRAGIGRAKLGIRVPLRIAHLRLAADMERLRLRHRQQLGVFGAYYRRRKLAVWAGAFALLTIVEIAIAFPLLIGPSRDAVASVDRAAQAIVSKATGDDTSASQAGAAADRGREVLGKGPAGSPEPENRSSGALPFAGGEESVSEEDTADSETVADHSGGKSSEGSSSGDRGRSAPSRRSEPVGSESGSKKDDSPDTSPASPQPQSPPAPPAGNPPPPPPPPQPAASTTTTTRTVALPPPSTTTTAKNPPPPPPPPNPPSTTTTTTASPPPPTTTTTTPREDCKRHRHCGGGDHDDDDDDDDDDD